MKQNKLIRLESDVLNDIKNNPKLKSFSQWVEDKYREEFMNFSFLVKKLEYYSKESNRLKDLIKNRKENNKSILTEQEKLWIKNEAKQRIKKTTFEGVFKFFCNNFGKDINRRQFKLLIKKYGTN